MTRQFSGFVRVILIHQCVAHSHHMFGCVLLVWKRTLVSIVVQDVPAPKSELRGVGTVETCGVVWASVTL